MVKRRKIKLKELELEFYRYSCGIRMQYWKSYFREYDVYTGPFKDEYFGFSLYKYVHWETMPGNKEKRKASSFGAPAYDRGYGEVTAANMVEVLLGRLW